MAQDRLFHKRLGHGERVTKLTDFEYIGWQAYVLSADDFGVMRLSAVTLQADHDRLVKKSPGAIERALNRAVELGLLMAFEHQGRQYVCQPDWQDYQKIRFPARSTNPIPPADVLAKCTALTQVHFRSRSVSSPKSPRENVNPSIDLPHGNGNGNGNALQEKKDRSNLIVPDDIAERAGRFVDRFEALYTEKRKGAKYLRRQPALDWDRACTLCRTWDDARLEKMATIFLTTDDEWISNSDRGFAVFAAKATWCDERLAAWEAKQQARA